MCGYSSWGMDGMVDWFCGFLISSHPHVVPFGNGWVKIVPRDCDRRQILDQGCPSCYPIIFVAFNNWAKGAIPTTGQTKEPVVKSDHPSYRYLNHLGISGVVQGKARTTGGVSRSMSSILWWIIVHHGANVKSLNTPS